MKRTFFLTFVLIFSLSALFSETPSETNQETDTPSDEVEINAALHEPADFTFSDTKLETYIPLEHWEKQAIYWSLKGTSLGLSAAHLIGQFIFPVLPEHQQDQLFILFDPWCHQLPSRSFHYSNGEQMPLCARCAGMNIGIFLGHFDSFIWDAFQIDDWERWQQGLLHIGSYSLLTLPLIIDGFVQKNNLTYTSNNPWRVTTGILFGYAMTAIADEVLQLILDYSGDVNPVK